MLEIRVDLVSARTGKRSLMGKGCIWNTEERTRETAGARGDYKATFSMKPPQDSRTWKAGAVRDFPRKTRGAWDLLYLALRSAVGSRNSDGALPKRLAAAEAVAQAAMALEASVKRGHLIAAKPQSDMIGSPTWASHATSLSESGALRLKYEAALLRYEGVLHGDA